MLLWTQVLLKDGSLIVKAKELAENVEVDLSKLQPQTPPQTQSFSPLLVNLFVGEYIRGYLKMNGSTLRYWRRSIDKLSSM